MPPGRPCKHPRNRRAQPPLPLPPAPTPLCFGDGDGGFSLCKSPPWPWPHSWAPGSAAALATAIAAAFVAHGCVFPPLLTHRPHISAFPQRPSPSSPPRGALNQPFGRYVISRYLYKMHILAIWPRWHGCNSPGWWHGQQVLGPTTLRGISANQAYLCQGPILPAAAAAQEVGARRSGSRQLTCPKISQQRAPQLATSPSATPSPRHRHRHQHLAQASVTARLPKSGLK